MEKLNKYAKVFGLMAIPYLYYFVLRPKLLKYEKSFDNYITKVDIEDIKKKNQLESISNNKRTTQEDSYKS